MKEGIENETMYQDPLGSGFILAGLANLVGASTVKDPKVRFALACNGAMFVVLGAIIKILEKYG